MTGTPVNGVYKLVEIDGIPVMKAASGKATYPGRKQIFRSFTGDKANADRLGLMTESLLGEEPLLQLVMQQGKRVQASESIAAIRERTSATVASLPNEVRDLNNPGRFAVEISTALQELTQQTQQGNEPQRREGREGR